METDDEEESVQRKADHWDRADEAQHLRAIVDALQNKTEPVYVIWGSDEIDHVAKRLPHKRVRFHDAKADTSLSASFGHR